MTPPVDPSATSLSAVPAQTAGRMFLSCDPARAHAVMTNPHQWADLLHRLGLTGSERADASAGSLPLNFGGTPLLLTQGGAARALLDASLADDIAACAALNGTRDAAVLAVEPLSEPGDRPMAAQRLCALTALLSPFVGARQLFWEPARLWSQADALADAVVTMESIGMPPVLHLVAFTAGPSPEPAKRVLVTRGLDWFSGFEMHVEAPAIMPVGEVIRRAARLAIDSLLNGDPVGPVDLPGLSDGETVHIAALDCREDRWWLPVVIDIGRSA